MQIDTQTLLMKLAVKAFPALDLGEIQQRKVKFLDLEYARLLLSLTKIESLSLNDAMNLALNESNARAVFELVRHLRVEPERLALDRVIIDSVDLEEFETRLPVDDIETILGDEGLRDFMVLTDRLSTCLFLDQPIFGFQSFMQQCGRNYRMEQYSILELLTLLNAAIDLGLLKVVRTEPELGFGFAITRESIGHLQEMFEALTRE